MQQKAAGKTAKKIAQTMNVSEIWVKKIWSKYRHCKISEIRYPQRLGRPKKGLYGRRAHAAVLDAYCNGIGGAVSIRERVSDDAGIDIPLRTMHLILKESGTAVTEPNKSKRRKWVRYEREHSNSMWRTDYKTLPDGRWFVSFQDDASRLIVGFGMFDESTGANVLRVLRAAIARYGKTASIMSDRGSQFYANAGEAKKKGASEFEKKN